MTESAPKPVLPLAAFFLAALAPLPLFLMGAWLGGIWLWAGFLYMAVFSVMLDQLVPLALGDAPEGREFPGADLLLLAIGGASLGLMALTVWVLSQPDLLSLGQKILLFLAVGYWLGQVGHPAAHELIHRPRRMLFRLGQSFYAAVLFGQHASAHRLIHHHYVATEQDPNSAREGEGFYRFAWRAWRGSFLQGLRAESALRARAKKARGPHPYLLYLAGSTMALLLALWLGGGLGLGLWIGLALHVQCQILVSDYVQHYGLRRDILANGKPEPLGPAHSWNTPHWFSSALMLNAPRHSDHHMNPARPYPALRLPPESEAPQLPWPLPLACALAFFPKHWKRAIRPHLRRWQPSRL